MKNEKALLIMKMTWPSWRKVCGFLLQLTTLTTPSTWPSWRKVCGFLLETVVLIWIVGVIFALVGVPVLLSIGAAILLALLLDFLQKKIWKTTLGNRSFCADDTAAFLQLPIAKQIRIVISSLVLLLGAALLFL